MTIRESINILENKKLQTNDDKLNKRLDSLISDLYEYFGESDEVDKQIAESIKSCDSSICSIDYTWVLHLNEAFLLMKRRAECKKFVNEKGIIDGEKAQWLTTGAQSIVGIISIIITFLFVFEIIPKSAFGVLGESGNSDALYYIIGTIAQQFVALVAVIVIFFVNKHYVKKKYKNADFSYEELLATKYEDSPMKLMLFSPSAMGIRNHQIKIVGDGNTVIDAENSAVANDDSQAANGKDNDLKKIYGNGNITSGRDTNISVNNGSQVVNGDRKKTI